MKVRSILSTAGSLALVLPLFAVFTSVHGGCVSGTYGTYGRYGYGGGTRTRSTTDCVAPDDDGGDVSSSNCDDAEDP